MDAVIGPLVRLVEAADKPAAVRVSVDGSTHHWAQSLRNEMDFRLLEAMAAGKQLRRSDLILTLSAMLDEHSRPTPAESERIFAKRAAKALDKGVRLYEFVVPFYATLKPGIRLPIRFDVLQNKYTLARWDRVTKQFNSSELLKALRLPRDIHKIPNPTLCWLVEKTATSAVEGAQALESSFDALRGILELTLGFLGTRFRFPEGPLRCVPHPPWILALDKATGCIQYLHFGFRFEKLDPKSGPGVSRKMLEAWKSNVSHIAQPPNDNNDIRKTIIDAVRLYALALDADRTHWAFIGFWQMAEALTLVEDSRSAGERICPRIASFSSSLGLDHREILHVLKDLYEQRNQAVHLGVHERIDDGGVNLLKNFCEIALGWIMQNRRKIEDRRTLARFYELNTANDANIKSLQRAIGLVRRREVS